MKVFYSIMIAFACWSPLISASETSKPKADPEPFFSEYVEGATARGPLDLALEIFNPTGVPINLSDLGYFIQIYADGALNPTTTILLNGLLAPNGTFVLVAAGADPALLARADQTDPSLAFDGNDLIVLGYSAKTENRQTTLLDAFGMLGNDPTPPGYWGTCPLCTANEDLRRDPSVLFGDTDLNDAYDTLNGWIAYSADDWTDLGMHTVLPVELTSFLIE